MIKLLKYDYRRDLIGISLSIIGAVLLIAVIEIFNLLGPKDTDLLGIKAMLLCIAFIITFLYKMHHLSEDTVINREHGMLIPKTPFQIVLSNSIVAFSYCIIAPIFAFIIEQIHRIEYIRLSIFLELTFYIKIFLFASVIFFFYIYIAWFYIFILKFFKKPSTAQNIIALVLMILFIVLLITGGLKAVIILLAKNLYLSGAHTVLMCLIGIFGVSRTVGHNFAKEKLETKLLYLVLVLFIGTSAAILII
ncbi:hypothetical protein [Oceanirhabdus sp. W0125-5]|uniref:hypothetical protein n=1 Tax=Oceanirhabdus sp. W0125-5 TaxID=2999116 RepID=UPI0022F32A60|nr:hypothetical protein [Oceanirhabdus sp. W0125-5]WBW94885.1 hypothetical protein OW730_14390 [Oceanirhabdus sp. W0125-5]